MQIDRRPLFDRLASFLAWVWQIADPTRADEAPDGYLGGPRLWVKREDATGLGFGGNKSRKFDYVLHGALSSGTDTIVSGGACERTASGRLQPLRQSSASLAILQSITADSNRRRRNTRPRATRSLIGCSAHTFMTCRGPVTAMQPFARSSAISKRRVTGRLCALWVSMPWAQPLMPRRFPRSNAGSAIGLRTNRYRALHRKRLHAGWARRRCSRGNAKHADRLDRYRRRACVGASRCRSVCARSVQSA